MYSAPNINNPFQKPNFDKNSTLVEQNSLFSAIQKWQTLRSLQFWESAIYQK